MCHLPRWNLCDFLSHQRNLGDVGPERFKSCVRSLLGEWVDLHGRSHDRGWNVLPLFAMVCLSCRTGCCEMFRRNHGNLTWVPDQGKTVITDPPPAAALIREDDQAHWYGSSGTCTLAFTDHEVDTPYLDPSTGAPLGIRKESYRYWVKTDPGASFTLNCTTTADATRGTEDLNGIADESGEAGVSWGVQCWAIDVVLAGTTIDPADQNKSKILPGQKLTASLNVHGAPLTVSSYSWAISGCGPFKNYDPTVTPPTFLGYSGDSSATTFAYLSAPGNAIVSCEFSASINGSSPTETVAGIAGKTAIVADVPAITFTVREFGYGGSSPYNAGLNNEEHTVILQYSGMEFIGSLTTPAPFYDPSAPNGDPGKWAFCQKITKAKRHYVDRSTGNLEDTINEDPCDRLDKAFPFKVQEGSNPIPGDGTESRAIDLPVSKKPISDVLGLFANDKFEMYMLYCPPGVESKYVAPKMHRWRWSGQITRTAISPTAVETWTATWGPCGPYGSEESWLIPQPLWTAVMN